MTGRSRSRRGPDPQEALRRIEAAFGEGGADDAPGAGDPVEGDAPDPAAPAAIAIGAAARMIEAMLFAATEPLTAERLAARLPAGADVAAGLAELARIYAGRGVVLAEIAGGWRLQTAADLEHLFAETRVEPKKLPKPALETLAVIAYHQPVTRAEIEDIRGVTLSKGALDLLLEIGWVRPRGRRRSPGRPLTYGTTDGFLHHFGLTSLDALPGKDDLKALGAIDARAARELDIPRPGEAHAGDALDEENGPAEGDGAFYVDHMADPAD